MLAQAVSDRNVSATRTGDPIVAYFRAREDEHTSSEIATKISRMALASTRLDPL